MARRFRLKGKLKGIVNTALNPIEQLKLTDKVTKKAADFTLETANKAKEQVVNMSTKPINETNKTINQSPYLKTPVTPTIDKLDSESKSEETTVADKSTGKQSKLLKRKAKDESTTTDKPTISHDKSDNPLKTRFNFSNIKKKNGLSFTEGKTLAQRPFNSPLKSGDNNRLANDNTINVKSLVDAGLNNFSFNPASNDQVSETPVDDVNYNEDTSTDDVESGDVQRRSVQKFHRNILTPQKFKLNITPELRKPINVQGTSSQRKWQTKIISVGGKSAGIQFDETLGFYARPNVNLVSFASNGFIMPKVMNSYMASNLHDLPKMDNTTLSGDIIPLLSITSGLSNLVPNKDVTPPNTDDRQQEISDDFGPEDTAFPPDYPKSYNDVLLAAKNNRREAADKGQGDFNPDVLKYLHPGLFPILGTQGLNKAPSSFYGPGPNLSGDKFGYAAWVSFCKDLYGNMVLAPSSSVSPMKKMIMKEPAGLGRFRVMGKCLLEQLIKMKIVDPGVTISNRGIMVNFKGKVYPFDALIMMLGNESGNGAFSLGYNFGNVMAVPGKSYADLGVVPIITWEVFSDDKIHNEFLFTYSITKRSDGKFAHQIMRLAIFPKYPAYSILGIMTTLTASRYASIFSYNNDPVNFAVEAVKQGYGTDPDYRKKMELYFEMLKKI